MGFPIVDTKEKGRLSTRKEREDAERYDDENWQKYDSAGTNPPALDRIKKKDEAKRAADIKRLGISRQKAREAQHNRDDEAGRIDKVKKYLDSGNYADLEK